MRAVLSIIAALVVLALAGVGADRVEGAVAAMQASASAMAGAGADAALHIDFRDCVQLSKAEWCP